MSTKSTARNAICDKVFDVGISSLSNRCANFPESEVIYNTSRCFMKGLKSNIQVQVQVQVTL
jgi:hypothetical protein